MEEFIVERYDMLVLVFPLEKQEEVLKELELKHPEYQATWRGPAGWNGKEVSTYRMIVHFPKPQERTGTYTADENAALDQKLRHDQLVAWAKNNHPPESWYNEDFTK